MNLTVYDDAIPYDIRSNIYYFSCRSTLQLGWKDHQFNDIGDINLHSKWTQEDLVNCGLWKYMEECIKLTPWFTKTTFKQCVLNLVRAPDVHLIHSHGSEYAVLYYVNLEWRDGWYGETLFYSEDAKDVVFTSPFVPGRMMLFDGIIPHTIRPQSTIAPKYRLTISTFFV